MTAAITLLATAALIGLYTLADVLFSRTVFWIKNISIAVLGFFGTFLIVSGILFALGAYSFTLTYVICFVIGAAAGVICVLCLKKGESPDVSHEESHRIKAFISTLKLSRTEHNPKYFYHCLAGLLVLGIAVSCVKHEFFGMGQDQGVYQTTAIYRLAGYNDVQIDLPGYHALTQQHDREMYNHVIQRARTTADTEPDERTQIGFYSNGSQYHLYQEPDSEVSGFFHGIPNFSALLSVSGRVFGLSGMTYINTLFLAVSIVLLFLTLNFNLKLKLSVSVFVTALFVLSPIVIWVSKSALTEPFLTLIMISFIYLVTNGHRHAKWLLWLPVAVFSFFHVSIYTMMPLFLLVFIVMYYQNRDNAIIVSGLVSLVAYFAGFFTMVMTGNSYTIDNYKPLRSALAILNLEYQEFLLFILGATLCAVIIFALCCYFIKKRDMKIHPVVFLNIVKLTMIVFLACSVFPWFYVFFHDRLPPTPEIMQDFMLRSMHRTIMAYVLMSGFLMVPLVLYVIYIKDKKLADDKVKPVVIMFIYCILVYSAFFRTRLEYYYYSARYLAPFISVILIPAGVWLDGLKPKISTAVLSACVALTLPFSLLITIEKDHSRIYWKDFEMVVSHIDSLEDNDIVIVSQEAMTYFFLPLNAMTDSIILPDAAGYYRIVTDRFSGADEGTGRVYFLSMHGGDNVYYLEQFDVDFEYEGYQPDSPDNAEVFRTRGRVSLPGFLPPFPPDMKPGEFDVYLTEVTDMNKLIEIKG